jgi:hypothetical protein
LVGQSFIFHQQIGFSKEPAGKETMFGMASAPDRPAWFAKQPCFDLLVL